MLSWVQDVFADGYITVFKIQMKICKDGSKEGITPCSGVSIVNYFHLKFK